MTAPAYHTHERYLHLLAAVRATPGDDLRRGVIADWLDENGHGERAELVRVSVRHGREPFEYGSPEWSHYIRLLAPLQDATTGHPLDYGGGWSFVRGFFAEWSGPFTHWCRLAPLTLPESVGLTVRLTDRPVAMFAGDAPLGATMQTQMTNVRCQLRGENGWAGDWHAGSLPVEDLLRLQWPDVAAWEVPSLADGLVGAWDGDMRPINLALLRLRETIPAPDA